jgi:ketohexokinase/beta-glucosidase
MDDIIAFISSSKRTSRLLYYKVIRELELDVSVETLARSLRKRGYSRSVALRKPPLTEHTKQLRLAWALEHVNWTREQWMQICWSCWSDESWVTSGAHKKIYVTRKEGEALDGTCLRASPRRRRGWMFWGSFHGVTKGPHLFWEKDWGSISSDSYRERVVSLLCGYSRQLKQEFGADFELFYMQDNAPGHAAQATLKEMIERGISIIYWPSYSPDLIATDLFNLFTNHFLFTLSPPPPFFFNHGCFS